jgi:5,10-methylene-tetrahydrofolate dehydrogenase/methenyl tetrahydrofolate cyclohydrolase
MNEKQMKKIVKRVKAKKRALSQTARRRTRLAARKDKGQVAQDIYRTKKRANCKQGGGDYTVKKYSYNEFEYGDPLAAKAEPATTSSRKAKAGENIFTIVD